MESIDPNYIVGLVDGEGSFTVYVKNPDKIRLAKRRVKVEPRFFLKLAERDRHMLVTMMYFFGCGNVYIQRDKRKNHQQCYRYEVANRAHLRDIIIPFFRKNSLRLNSRKRDFEIFCRIMKEISKGGHLNDEGLRRIYGLKQKMHRSSSYAGNPQVRWEHQY